MCDTIEQMKLPDIRKQLYHNAPYIKALLIVVAVYGIFAAAGHGCPIRYVTGIPCPGCGLSRAYIALLHLNIREAFSYHPMFWAIPVLVLACLRYEKYRGAWTKALMILLGLGFVVLYVFRLSTGDPAVTVDIHSGLFYRVVNGILSIWK